MSSSSRVFDEGDVEVSEETQEESMYNGETQNSLRDVNDSGKSYENDIEMVATLKKIEEIKLKVVSWLKSQEKKIKKGHEEGMQLLFAFDGIRKYEQHRNVRKYLDHRIQSALDIADAFTQEIQKLTLNSGIIQKEISQKGVHENVANSSNDVIDIIKETMSPNEIRKIQDESMEVIDTLEEKKKPESDDTRLKSKKLNIGDALMINSGDGKDEEEVNSEVIGLFKSYQSTYPQSGLKKCCVLLEKSKVQTDKTNLKGSENRLNSNQNIKPPMFSAAKRRRMISEPEENNIEYEKKFHNNCEVREAIIDKLKVDPATGEDVINAENGNIVQVTCDTCNQMFTNASTLLVHSEKHHKGGKGTRYCLLCTYTGNRTSMLQHIRAKHTGEKLFKCKSCEARFDSCKRLKSHVKSDH